MANRLTLLILSLPLLAVIPVLSGAEGGPVSTLSNGAQETSEPGTQVPSNPAEGQGPSETGSQNNAQENPGRSDLVFGKDRAWLSMPVRLEVTRDYLEFLLVNPHGGVHESLFSTTLDAQVLNTAILALGLTPGKNVRWEALMGDPLEGVGLQGPQQRQAAPSRDSYKVLVPEGDSLFLYAAWQEGDESFFFRVEDLVRDLDRGRTLRRHAFVYLGSFLMPTQKDAPARFAASMEGNLINIAFFRKPSALLTTAVEECDKQSNWLANSWLLPEPGSEMRLVFSKAPLTEVPTTIGRLLPKLPAQEAEPPSED